MHEINPSAVLGFWSLIDHTTEIDSCTIESLNQMFGSSFDKVERFSVLYRDVQNHTDFLDIYSSSLTVTNAK